MFSASHRGPKWSPPQTSPETQEHLHSHAILVELEIQVPKPTQPPSRKKTSDRLAHDRQHPTSCKSAKGFARVCQQSGQTIAFYAAVTHRKMLREWMFLAALEVGAATVPPPRTRLPSFCRLFRWAACVLGPHCFANRGCDVRAEIHNQKPPIASLSLGCGPCLFDHIGAFWATRSSPRRPSIKWFEARAANLDKNIQHSLPSM